MPAENTGQSRIAELEQRVRLLEAVVENFPGGLMLFDKDLRLVFCNRNQRRMLDYPESLFGDDGPSLEDIIRFNALRGEYGPGDVGAQIADRMAKAARNEEHAYERTRPNGINLEIRGRPLPGGGFVTTYLDVTERRKGQQALAYLAQYDPLTMLLNRSALTLELDRWLGEADADTRFAVLFLDLNGFKPVNDRHGHAAGDRVLEHVGARLLRITRAQDIVARYGGDEFVIVQGGVSETRDIDSLATRILEAMDQPFEVDGNIVQVGVSIGIAAFPADGLTSMELITKADQSMYLAKLGYSPFVHNVERERLRANAEQKRVTVAP